MFSFKQLITLVFLPQALSMPEAEEERGRRRRSATNEPNYLSTLRIGRGSVHVGSACVGREHLPKPNANANEDDLMENSLNLAVDEEEGKGKNEDEEKDHPKELDVES